MSSPEISTSRVVNASAERIAEAIRDPEQLAKWWGPKGFTNTFHSFDFRVGGKWDLTMHAPDGNSFENHWEFVVVDSPHRFALRHIQAAHTFTLTITLAPAGEKCGLTWHMEFETAEQLEAVRPYVIEGNEQNLDRLEAHLAPLSA